jgi:Bifunctional DNA primase/polymerase, N-terminal/AAA domain
VTPAEAALRYAGNGWRVVPVLPGSKRPALTRWTEAATADAEKVRRWWTEEHPDAGVGIVTGPGSGLWVLDVDDPDSLAELEERHERLPATLTSITGSGGYHLFFRWPAGAEVRNDAGRRLGPGLDVRGEGGFVVAPPTLHPNGAEYAWDLGEPEEPADAPAWLLELVTREEARPERPARLELARSDRPGDRWAAATTWSEILTADGWTHHHTDRDGEGHWVRPGKDPRDGTSATTNYGGSDVLKVFTSNPPPGLTEGETYTKLGYLAATRWSGDHSAAARFLAGQGWGGIDPDDLAHWIDLGPSPVRDGGNAERDEVGGMVARTLEAAPAAVAEDEGDDDWQVVDLSAILDGSWDPPVPTMGLRTDGVGLLYPGRVHSFSGEPGGGKTWLGLHHVAEVIRSGGSAGMIDYEDGPEAIVVRLLALGVAADAVRDRFVYVRPDGPVGNLTVARLVALGLSLWVVDSVGEALAVEGLNPNADEDVAQWYRKVPRRLAAGGSAVELLDHVAKDRETRGSWAIGSQRKLAAIDGAAYTVAVVKAPTKDDDGHLRVKCAKDRHGAHRRGEYVAEVLVLNADDGGVSVVVRRPEGGARLTTYMERVSEFLEAVVVLDGPPSANKIEKGVEGGGTKIRAALHSLIEEGFVEVERTSKGHFHRLVRPYRQATDPASDRFEEPGGSFLDAVREVASNGVQPVDNPAEDADLVPRPDLVPTSSRTNPEPDLVPSSPPYVVGGTRDEVAVYEEPAETPGPRPSFLAPDPDELDVPDEDLDA